MPGISATSVAARTVVEGRPHVDLYPDGTALQPVAHLRGRAQARFEAERLRGLVVRDAAPLEDVPLIGKRELRRIGGPDVRRDRRRDHADGAARLDRLLPQLPHRGGPEDHRALDVLPLVIRGGAGADVHQRRVDHARRRERVDAQRHPVALARQEHFAGVGERHRRRLVVPPAAAGSKFLDAVRDTRRLEPVADAVDRRVEPGVPRDAPELIHEADDVHRGGAVHTIRESPVGSLGGLRNRRCGRLPRTRSSGLGADGRSGRGRDEQRPNQGAHGTPVRSRRTSTPVSSRAESGARRPGHSTPAPPFSESK